MNEKSTYQGQAVYIGWEFPDHHGKPIWVYDDNTDPHFKCYQIKFENGETADNIDDHEIQWLPTKNQ